MPPNPINEKLQNLKTQSLSTVVGEQLEQMILNGELKPGERINESFLSNLLQISRAPIREACRQLAQYGLIENRVGKGSYIRLIELDEATELYELRAVLDALAAEQVSLQAKPADLKRLGAVVEKMRKLVEQDQASDYFASNLEFHRTIIELSHNKSLQEMYDVVFRKLFLFRQRTLAQPNRLQISFEQHEGIFQAICDKDAVRAFQLARGHVEGAKKVLLAQIHEPASPPKN